MKHGSLFSGIGGFDLASEWMGRENVFHCEWNPFGQKVLKYYWPSAIGYNDITKTVFDNHRGNIDVLTGGFPCQPYSMAGQRRGKEDDRHLWPEMLRAIREIRPRWVVGENVRGLISWDGGVVFDEVQADLEAEGYEVVPFLLPACAVDADQKRERTWFVAHVIGNGFQSGLSGGASSRHAPSRNRIENKIRLAGSTFTPSEALFCDGYDGLSDRLDGITFPKWRNESIKAAGNAIVPQVVYQIFKAIEAYENIYA